MWHKILPVIGILLAGCLIRDEQGAFESQPEPTKAMATDSISKKPAYSESQPSIQAQPPLPLADLGPAPELTNEIWLNTDHPLRLADLKGSVVLLEMWTFG